MNDLGKNLIEACIKGRYKDNAGGLCLEVGWTGQESSFGYTSTANMRTFMQNSIFVLNDRFTAYQGWPMGQIRANLEARK